MELREEFGSNETAEVDGVWQELGEDAGVKVARLGNPEAQNAYRRIPRPMRRQIEAGTLANKQSLEFLSKFLADHILKDWRGFVDNGKPVPSYTPEEGKKYLTKYRRFRDKVWEISMDEDFFNTEEAEDTKNLSKRSGGS